MAVPVKVGGNVIGVLMSYMKWKPLEDLVASVKVAKTGYVWVISKDRKAIIHPDRKLYGVRWPSRR